MIFLMFLGFFLVSSNLLACLVEGVSDLRPADFFVSKFSNFFNLGYNLMEDWSYLKIYLLGLMWEVLADMMCATTRKEVRKVLLFVIPLLYIVRQFEV